MDKRDGYTLTQKEYRNLKSRLTRVINKKDPEKIIAECQYAINLFAERGYPDDWARWQRALDDAMFSKQRSQPWRF